MHVRQSRTPHLLAFLIAAGTGCVLEGPAEERAAHALFAAPNAVFTAVRPLDGAAIVYEPLAPRIHGAALEAQLSIDVVVRNDETASIDVDRVRLSYSGGGARPADTRELDIRKRCDGEGVVDLTTDRTIAPGEACRLILLHDLKLALPAPADVTIEVFFAGFTQPISTQHALQAHRNAPLERSYRFPAQAEDLASGLYWTAQSTGGAQLQGFPSHHRDATAEMYAYDAGVVRWDGTDWNRWKPGTTGVNNSDFLVWEQPVYAMADGVVRAFDNSRIDNPVGTKASSANFFSIDHGDEVGGYFHLRKGSLNPALMTVGAPVQAGDFLGLAGNSGSSSEPHLHIQVTRDGVGLPLLFHEAFVIDRAAPSTTTAPALAPFTAMNDHGLTWEKNLIWPSPFRRANQASSGGVSSAGCPAAPAGTRPAPPVAITQAASALAVTASRAASGDLVIESWGVGGDGAITARDVETAGPVCEIAIAHDRDVMTAFRNSDGDLEVINWSVDTFDGTIAKTDEKTAGPISQVAVTHQPHNRGMVTAFRDGDGELGLIAWDVAVLSGDLTRKGENGAGPITQVAITTAERPCDCVVTAVRNGEGKLQLTSWRITSAQQIVRVDDELGGAISDVALTTVQRGASEDFVVAGVRGSANQLELIVFEVTSTGQLIRRGEAVAGEITDVALSSDGVMQLVSTVRDASDELKLIGWEITPAGALVREGETSAGTVTGVAATSSFSSGGKRFAVPAMRDSSDKLRLISWQTNLTP